MENFGKRLKRLRAKKGLTLQQVAERVPVPSSTYKEWEYGRAIQGEPYLKLAEIFEVALSELMTGNPPRPQVIEVGNQLKEVSKSIQRIEIALRSLF